ncbi:cobyric acid synthase CobQ [Pseudoalteromonas sp. NBT06-2]|uniref:cobyric acid synthase n=1 Tax=Pseudoalteromonas sp. NBT06-2 TaxID=2025950 RepID=UPI000BA4FB7D|nr:cobyric acid synthase [Pseudoalteromonas sp. NBT06-2]PAJ72583.1 cobyric acid synthase CobQ [Pseudoalteromonas sp. NBT06-2]
MVQGTTSDAGKTTLVCGLGRVFKRKGIKVAPFKPQNMALNSAVTIDGGEIGRAQALQAQACNLEPVCDFNPVLLKPSSDIGCQVIINGQIAAQLDAQNYHDYKPTAMKAVLKAHKRLAEKFESILVEGAGSPAEINLRDRDIANMGFAEEVDCPVILIADIDKGGVFAHLTGTLACLSESEQNRVIGFVINRFRGDAALLTSGLDWLEEQTGKPVLGVLPYLQGLHLDSEDSVALEQVIDKPKLNVVIPVYPRTSNHNDFDSLRAHPDVNVQLVGPQLMRAQATNSELQSNKPKADLLILPGSKNTQADLTWFKEQGWEEYIKRHLRYDGKVLAICGGLQMLGIEIKDPNGIESPQCKTTQGLGLLPLITTLQANKALSLKKGMLQLPGQNKVAIQGYEIHTGNTFIVDEPLNNLADIQQVVFDNDELNACFGSGVISEDNQIFASYWHGLMDTPEALTAILNWATDSVIGSGFKHVDYQALREHSINHLADNIEQEFDWNKLTAALKKFNR